MSILWGVMPYGPVEFLKEYIASIFRVKEYARQASAVACCLFILYAEDEGIIFLQNMCQFLPDHIA
jgi:hypothetical protein